MLEDAQRQAGRAGRTIVDEATHFVLAVVTDTWVRELRDTDSLYTEVGPKELLHISKRVSPAGTPSTSWRCITKCSATTLKSRASPSILICLRTPNGKPAGQEEQSRTRPYSSFRVRLCWLASASPEQTTIEKNAQSAIKHGQNGRLPTIKLMLR